MNFGIIVNNGRCGEQPKALVLHDSYEDVKQFELVNVDNKKAKMKHKPTNRDPHRMVTIVSEDTLLYGTSISWQQEDMGRNPELVTKYAKQSDHFKPRFYNGDAQLLLQGVMSTTRKLLWMGGRWPDLEIPHRLQRKAHPNVTVDAWVTLFVGSDQKIKYELHSFEGAADSYQFLVRQAAWNKPEDGNLPILNDPLAENVFREDSVASLPDTLQSIHGIVVSNETILACDARFKTVCYHRIVINDDVAFPAVGARVRFNAEKLDFLNIYACKDVIEMNCEKEFPISENGMLKVTIRHKPELPGFFFSEKLGCYLDDPENILQTWQLTPYSKSTLQVAVTATEPSARGTSRLVVAEITDAKLKKIEKFQSDGLAKLVNEPGIVIDLMGRIHLPRIPKSDLRLPSHDRKNILPGAHVLVDATLTGSKWIIDAVKANEQHPNVRAVVVKSENPTKPTIWFNVPEARGCRELPFLFSTSHFGLIESPYRRPQGYRVENVWVTINNSHPGDMNKPQAKFKIAHVGEITENSEPIEQFMNGFQ